MGKKLIKISENELHSIINKTIDEIIHYDNQIVEGVQYNKENNSFTFDFLNDTEHDIIKLVNHGLSQSEVYNNCFYYKYQFEGNTDSKVRGKFIEYMKFHNGMLNKDINMFVKKAVNSLDDTINLREYNTVIYPQSISEINRKVISYIRKFGYPNFLPFELVKEPPQVLTFDYESYKREVLDATHKVGNKELPRYTEKQKQDELDKIKSMMDNIKKGDYFSIGRDMKYKYRHYINNFYKFANDEEKNAFNSLKSPNVLVIDDVMTSGATLSYVIDTIYQINPKAKVIVFTIIGKNLDD